MELSGRKIKPRRLSKPFEHMQIYIYSFERSILFTFGLQVNKNLRLPITQPRYAKTVNTALNHEISIVSNG